MQQLEEKIGIVSGFVYLHADVHTLRVRNAADPHLDQRLALFNKVR